MTKKNKTLIDNPSKGDIARQQLISSAMLLFAENGIDGASTRQIASHASQNIGAIAYYFESKEGLYRAVLESIIEYIRHQFASQLVEIDQFLSSGEFRQRPDDCLSYIKRLLKLQVALLTKPETMAFSQLLLREQMAPTKAFPLIHERALAPLHSRFTQLIAGYSGLDENAIETILHAHALIGEALAFRVGLETLRLRTGWQTLDETAVKQIEQTLLLHIEWILQGLRQDNKN